MLKYIAAAATIALMSTSSAQALTVISLYNTGVDNAGVATTGNGADLHWTLAGGTAYTGGTNGSFPISPWLAETSASRWITPTGNAADDVGGSFTYSTTFSLAGFDAATAALSGRFAGDNAVTAITLNDKLISTGADGFTSYTAFSSGAAAFVAGINTLTFVLRNDGGPAGLRVEVESTADIAATVPEPASWTLMIAGFGLVGFAARRRSSAVVA